MSRRDRSYVWQDFIKIDQNSATCNLCNKVVQTKGNTTNLKNHLARAHARKTQTTKGTQERDAENQAQIRHDGQELIEELGNNSTQSKVNKTDYRFKFWMRILNFGNYSSENIF